MFDFFIYLTMRGKFAVDWLFRKNELETWGIIAEYWIIFFLISEARRKK